MILSIFLIVIGLAVVLIGLGFLTNDPAIQILGLSFLFIGGSILLAGNVEYQTGINISEYYVYGDNYSGYHWDYDTPHPECNPSNPLECVALMHTERTETNLYNNFNDTTSHFIGVYLMIISIFGMAVILTRLKQENDNGV